MDGDKDGIVGRMDELRSSGWTKYSDRKPDLPVASSEAKDSGWLVGWHMLYSCSGAGRLAGEESRFTPYCARCPVEHASGRTGAY